jgi:hypothetical protein
MMAFTQRTWDIVADLYQVGQLLHIAITDIFCMIPYLFHNTLSPSGVRQLEGATLEAASVSSAG